MNINIAKINFKSLSISIAKVNFAGDSGGDTKKEYMYFTPAAGQAMIYVDYLYDEYFNTHGKYLQTSSDMKNWTDWNKTKTVLRNTKLYVRGLDDYVRNSNNNNAFFNIPRGLADCGGNIMSLCNFSKNITTKYCFAYLFKDGFITTSPKLPATVLTDACYRGMFYNAKLAEAPALPAIDLKPYCYKSMFMGCTSLTTAPELPATKMEVQCYNAMFQGCSNLTTAPKITATTLADACYGNMLYNCSHLNEIVYSGAYDENSSLGWVLGVSATGNFYNYSGTDIPVGSNGIPEGWVVVEPMYFTPSPGVESVTMGYNYDEYYNLHNTYLLYSFNGINWNFWDNDKTIENGQHLFVIGTHTYVRKTVSTKGFFYSSAEFDCNGDVMSLCNYAFDSSLQYCFHGLFKNTLIRTAPKLNSINLLQGCYEEMFANCTKLVKAPDLPATNALSYCYSSMFSGCTSLIEAPRIDLTRTATNCCRSMFQDCTSLTKAPDLPATTLTTNCYLSMFQGCTSLTKAPDLPATTLASACYQSMFADCTSLSEVPDLVGLNASTYCYNAMFQNCTSLVKAPKIYANRLYGYCFQYMFSGCTSLIEAPELISESLITSCYKYMFINSSNVNWIKALFNTYNSASLTQWVKGVATDGVFVMSITATWDPDANRGVSGVPTGWKVIYYDNTEDKYYLDKEKQQECDKYGNIVLEPFYITPVGTNGITAIANANYYTLHGKYLKYSFNKNDWQDWNGYVTIQPNQKMYVKGEDDYVWTSSTYGKLITAGGNYNVGGYISSLTNGITDVKTYTFYSLFYNDNNIIDASELLLPATQLTDVCYTAMFEGCTGLTTAPALPATTLAGNCYGVMFKGCTSLTTAPALPATTLAGNCYNGMFEGCTGLTTAPALPATTLAQSCYNSMFKGCTSLTTAPALPATTLAQSCYNSMFYGCTGLTTAPALPATKLYSTCYSNMFYGCTGLTTAPALPATTLSNDCYTSMFRGCTGLITAPALPAKTLAKYCYTSMFNGCTGLTVAPQLPATTLANGCYSNMFTNDITLNWIKSLNIGYSSVNFTGWVNGVANEGVFVANINATYDPESIRGTSGIPENWLVIYYDSAEDKYYLDKGKQQECDDHGNPIGGKTFNEQELLDKGYEDVTNRLTFNRFDNTFRDEMNQSPFKQIVVTLDSLPSNAINVIDEDYSETLFTIEPDGTLTNVHEFANPTMETFTNKYVIYSNIDEDNLAVLEWSVEFESGENTWPASTRIYIIEDK